ncbi:MAG TPA: NYN domain-containing protein, partial [Dehalococcoidia bacterium]|nr:NYN domain-containing protein [Dehalococcoidia bacterium]
MTGTGEVALFVDFENIRYGLRRYSQEPVIPQLMEKARKYGTVAVALAYADFGEHPEWVRRQMDVAGISARDVPLHRSYSNGIERVKSTADLHMVMDIMETVLDRPNVHTYVLMAGDSDYIRVTTWLRNRFGKKVVVSGVPGSISADLVLAAGNEDPVEPQPELEGAEQEAVIAALIGMVHRR